MPTPPPLGHRSSKAFQLIPGLRRDPWASRGPGLVRVDTPSSSTGGGPTSRVKRGHCRSGKSLE